MNARGFTVLELVIATALLLVAAGALAGVFSSTTRFANVYTGFTGNVQELQTAASIIADDVRRASTIIQADQTHPLSDLDTIAPGVPDKTGSDLIITTAVKPDDSTCTTDRIFNAYYAAPRSTFTALADTVVDRDWLALDSAGVDDTKLALMKLEGCFDPTSGTFSDVTARFVADFLSSATFTYTQGSSGLVSEITVALVSERTVQGQTVRTPPSGSVSVVAYARNIQ